MYAYKKVTHSLEEFTQIKGHTVVTLKCLPVGGAWEWEPEKISKYMYSHKDK